MVAFGMFSMGYFGLVMNVIWPALMFGGVAYAIKMTWNQMRSSKKIPGLFNCLGKAFGKWNWTPLKNWLKLLNDEFIKPCTIEWGKELGRSIKNMIRYFRGAY
jgi:hypothetical protein